MPRLEPWERRARRERAATRFGSALPSLSVRRRETQARRDVAAAEVEIAQAAKRAAMEIAKRRYGRAVATEQWLQTGLDVAHPIPLCAGQTYEQVARERAFGPDEHVRAALWLQRWDIAPEPGTGRLRAMDEGLRFQGASSSFPRRVAAALGALAEMQTDGAIDADRLAGRSKAFFWEAVRSALVEAANLLRSHAQAVRRAQTPLTGLPRAILQAVVETADGGCPPDRSRRLAFDLLEHCQRGADEADHVHSVELAGVARRLGWHPSDVAAVLTRLDDLRISVGGDTAAARLFDGLRVCVDVTKVKGGEDAVETEIRTTNVRFRFADARIWWEACHMPARASIPVHPWKAGLLNRLSSTGQTLACLVASLDLVYDERTTIRLTGDEFARQFAVPARLRKRLGAVVAGLADEAKLIRDYTIAIRTVHDTARRGHPLTHVEIAVMRRRGLRGFDPDGRASLKIRYGKRPYNSSIPPMLVGLPHRWDWRRPSAVAAAQEQARKDRLEAAAAKALELPEPPPLAPDMPWFACAHPSIPTIEIVDRDGKLDCHLRFASDPQSFADTVEPDSDMHPVDVVLGWLSDIERRHADRLFESNKFELRTLRELLEDHEAHGDLLAFSPSALNETA